VDRGRDQTWDAIVVGAGPGGATTAAFLARAGVRVLLLDQAEFPRDKTCGDAISPNALAIVRELGLADEMEETGFRVSGVRLVAPDGGEAVAPVPPRAGRADHLRIARRFEFDDLLLRNAVAAGAVFEPGVNVTDVDTSGGRAEVTGSRGGRSLRFSAAVAVLAVGASTLLPRRTGLLSGRPRFGLGARAYFHGIAGLEDRIDFRFDAMPLPGYGWIFPLSEDSANVGAGFLTPSSRVPPNPRAVLKRFLGHGPVRAMMAGSRRQGPVRAFPVRTDFATAGTVGERLVAVGEAAGLVNPFTGEGIDYAMVSGKVAAGVLARQLQSGDVSAAALCAYDRQLRDRFQHLFVWTVRMRRLYLNRRLLNPLVRAARREPAVARRVTEVVLGYRSAASALSPRMVFQVLRSWRTDSSRADG
jgi:geranylgeranyl reductase family protein